MMKELINKVFDDKMKDGSIEKIIADHVDTMIKKICEDQMGWNGAARKAMAEKINPLILQAVENSDIGSMVTKITLLINTAMNGSELENYQDALASVRSLFGANDGIQALQKKKVVTLSELFEMYKKYLQYIYDRDDFDDEDINDEDGNETASINCCVRVTEEERYFAWRKPGYDVEFSTDKSNDEKSGDIRLKLRWNYDSTKLYLWGDFRSMSLGDLQHCPEFILYLATIERMSIAVEVDTTDDDDEIDIDCRRY